LRGDYAGFAITSEALASGVAEYVGSPAVAGWANMGAAITALKNTPELRWVNPLELKNAVESALTDRFGAKGAAKPKAKVHFPPLMKHTIRPADSRIGTQRGQDYGKGG